MKIGLTGGIASGKSTVAEMFRKRGFGIIDLDKLSRTVMEPNGAAYDKVVAEFGSVILDSEGRIMRHILRDIVLGDEVKLRVLEEMTHPAIFIAERAERARLLLENPKSHVITEAALLIESGAHKNYDIVIIVVADEQMRIARAVKRSGITHDSVAKIVALQSTDNEKAKHAHIIINNSEKMEALENEVERVSNLISQITYGVKHP